MLTYLSLNDEDKIAISTIQGYLKILQSCFMYQDRTSPLYNNTMDEYYNIIIELENNTSNEALKKVLDNEVELLDWELEDPSPNGFVIRSNFWG